MLNCMAQLNSRGGVNQFPVLKMLLTNCETASVHRDNSFGLKTNCTKIKY